MATQQQGQQFHEQQAQGKRRKKLSQRTLVIATVVAIAVAVATIWILSSLRIIPGRVCQVFCVNTFSRTV
jgi:hypothetical protein